MKPHFVSAAARDAAAAKKPLALSSPSVALPSPNIPNVPFAMVFKGVWDPTQSYSPGDVVTTTAQFNPLQDLQGLWVCFQSAGPNQAPDEGFPYANQYWYPLNPLNGTGVAGLVAQGQPAFATGNVVIASTDGSLLVDATATTPQGTSEIDIRLNGALSVNATDADTISFGGTGINLASPDGSIVFQSNPATNTLFLQVQQLQVQSVLDAGIAADLVPLAAPVVAPSSPVVLFANAGGVALSGYAGFAGNWIAAPLLPLQGTISLVPGAKYQLSGILNVSWSGLPVASYLNVSARIAAAAPASPAQTLPTSVALFGLVDTVAGNAAGNVYQPISVIFTCPDAGGVRNLGLDSFLTLGGVATTYNVSVQWVNSFSVARLYSSLVA
jgi:hypothetical protein